jgi:hypothetical protein
MMVGELKGAKVGKPPREVGRRNIAYLVVTSHSPPPLFHNNQGIQGFRAEEDEGW